MQARESKKAVLFYLLILIFVLGSQQASCKNNNHPDKEASKTYCCPVPDQGKPFPTYLRSDLMPLQKNRWDSIPENRRSEFSFNTRLYPFQEPLDPTKPDRDTWRGVPQGLHGSFVSKDCRYSRSVFPDVEVTNHWKLAGWKGERLSAQIVLWSSSDAKQVRWKKSSFRSDDGDSLSEDCLAINFVRYVLADDGTQGGRGAPPETKLLVADVLDGIERFDLPAGSVRPLWITVQIPRDAKAGVYQAEITVAATNTTNLSFTLDLEILPQILPPSSQWSFHLDLWQNPWAVARYHNVRPWSKDHWSLLRPLIRMLAGAGQKCITTTIISRPWGGQTYDAYESMIDWVRQADGTWRYDYSVFDRYVEFCMENGITEQISCYSVISWSGYSYFDEASGEIKTLSCQIASPEYREHWRPFLSDFLRHLKEKGWFERTVFAIDEAPLDNMQKFIGFLKSDAPELKIGLAGEYHAEIRDDIYNWCFYIDQEVSSAVLKERKELNRPNTFYVCCGPIRPNTFTFSPPVESAWLGWYAAARGFDGFLRWAYNSWPMEPMVDSRYISWPAGDCFLVYPGARSPIRFERLREGIQDYEKIRLLRNQLAGSSASADREKLERLGKFLATIVYDSGAGPEYYLNCVRAGKELLERLSR